MNVDIIKERSQIIKDLEKTFTMALEAGDYKAAIQAKYMIGKVCGFFDDSKRKKNTLSLMELSTQDLEMLLTEAQDIKKWQNLSEKNIAQK